MIELRRDGGIERIELEPQDSYRLELENLSDAIRGEASCCSVARTPSARPARIEALHESATSGEPVSAVTDGEARERAAAMLEQAGIVLTPAERAEIEVADFGLGRLEEIGLQLVVYVNTERVCAKELVLFPHQICPEHRHPPVGGEPGQGGDVPLPARARCTLHVEGADEIVLRPGEQYTILPDTLHWFQAGPEGAIVSEFSTQSRDELDVFSDPQIVR